MSSAGEWRRGLERLANALMVYGVVGILAAAIGLVALIAASGRIGSLIVGRWMRRLVADPAESGPAAELPA